MDFKEYIKEKHGEQKRKQGTPYYLHPIAVSQILKEKNFDEKYQIVGLFHDLLEDTNTTYEEIVKISNKEIAEAVRLLTKEKGYNMNEYIERIKNNNLAKMVKLADKIHNLSETGNTNEDFIKKHIKQTTDWYIDLAKGTIFEEDMKKELKRLKKQIKNKK